MSCTPAATTAVAGRKRRASGVGGEGDLGAVGSDRTDHEFLDVQAVVGRADWKDRAVVVTPLQRVEGIAAIDATVLRDDRRGGVGGLPLAPGGAQHGGLVEHDPLFLQRPRHGGAGERVEHRLGAQVVHHLVRTRQQAGGTQDRNLVGPADRDRVVGAVGLSRSAQRAVRDPEPPVAEREVEHLVDLGDVLGDRKGLVAFDDAEHDRIVGIPVAA